MDLNVYEHDQEGVLEAFLQGDFDYIDGASETYETEFFRYIGAQKILKELAESYPSPRHKHEVPLWMHVSSNLTLRLHGEAGFHSYDMMVPVGGMFSAFTPQLGHKVVDKGSGDFELVCNGFNQKNQYARRTPMDQDTLRKLARDTAAEKLMNWYNANVAKMWLGQKAYDLEGIFIGDASYLFVPDNPRYEGSSRMRFDEGNHPVSRKAYERMTTEDKARCRWRRCYKMVSLLHVSRKLDYHLFAAVRVLPGKASECPVLYEMVEQFVKTVGKGVMRRLILDRGFLDGEAIGRCKLELGVDVLVPLKKNMDIYTDAEALFDQSEVEWTEIPLEKPKRIVREERPVPQAVRRRELARQKTLAARPKVELPPEKTLVRRQTAAMGSFTSWGACPVPLSVVANREHYADGSVKTWYLVDTRKLVNAVLEAEEYHLRTAIEERHRQLKCFADLMHFTSRSFNLVTNHVVFVLLAYSLLQLHLWKTEQQDLNSRPPDQVRRKLLPRDSYVLVYYRNCFAKFHFYEYTEILTNQLSEEARKKIGEKCRRRHREMIEHELQFRRGT